MCTGYSDTLGKIFPVEEAVRTGDKKKLDPFDIFQKPTIPAPPDVTRPQSAKQPDTQPLHRRNQSGGPASSDTLLTGPSGISVAQLRLGGSTLLAG